MGERAGGSMGGPGCRAARLVSGREARRAGERAGEQLGGSVGDRTAGQSGSQRAGKQRDGMLSHRPAPVKVILILTPKVTWSI